MNDKLLDRYTKRGGHDPESDQSEGEDAENLGSFGWLRGVRDRAIMLELRKKDGHLLAVGYAWIERVEFDPENGITLHLPGRKVRVRGSGLNTEVRPTIRLFDGITRHRVPWIRESDRPEQLGAGKEEIVVEKIVWDE